MTKIRKEKKSNEELVNEFWSAHENAFFRQETLAAILCKSIKSMESDRWNKVGCPYRKIGNSILYRKGDILFWLNQHVLYDGTI